MTPLPTLSVLLTLLSAFGTAQTYPYTITDLRTLPGKSGSVAWGISADGRKIVGWATDRAFLWEEGVGMRDLGTLPGYGTGYARDIDPTGRVAGQAGLEVSGPEPARAVRFEPGGAVTNLGTIGGGRFSMAWAINSTGNIAGDTEVLPTTTLWHAFLWKTGTGMIDLTPNALSAFGRDLNDRDQVTGYQVLALSGGNRAFRHDPVTGAVDLGLPATFAHSFGTGINAAGQVCGHATSASGNTQRAARYTDGIGWEILGGVGQTNQGIRINSFGQVVGTGRPTAGLQRAWIYTDGLGMEDLTPLVDPAAGWLLLGAHDVNDRGQITGYGFNNVRAETAAFRLDPDPRYLAQYGAACPPSGPALLAAGTPAAGHAVSILLANGAPNAPAVLVIAAAQGSLPLPGGCTLLLQGPMVFLPTALSALGSAQMTFTLPNPSPPGAAFFQAFVIDAAAPNGMFRATNAARIGVVP